MQNCNSPKYKAKQSECFSATLNVTELQTLYFSISTFLTEAFKTNNNAFEFRARFSFPFSLFHSLNSWRS